MNGVRARDEWARCRPWIVAALLHSPELETIEDVEWLIEQGRYQFWPGLLSAAVTEIVEFHRAKALVIRHAGGDLEELTNKMEPAFCVFARAHGCTKIMGEGREGWKRVCRRMGYALGFVVMVKDLQS
jgi:hypothetical protein